MNIMLLMMGGSGTRLGADIPKQYIMVDDMPIFAYILKKGQAVKDIDKIVIVSHANWIDFVEEWVCKLGIDKTYKVVAGGNTRSDSVKNGLSAINEFASEEDIVLIHDATHPYIDEEGTRGVIEGVKKYGGATLGGRQFDTMYMMNEDNLLSQVIPREKIVSGASPEAFHFGDIYGIYNNSSEEELAKMTSAGAIALAHGIKMEVIPSNVLNLKITYAGDLELFKKLAKNYFFCS